VCGARERDFLRVTFGCSTGMILFFYGNETLQPGEKVRALIARYTDKNAGGAGLVQCDCADKETTVQMVCDALSAASLFTQRRLIVIHNPFAFAATDQRTLAQQLEHVADSDVVVVWEHGVPRTNAVLFKTLQSCAQTVKEYTVPKGQAYVAWIARRLHAIAPGTKITRSAATRLAACIGDDLVRMHNVLAQCAAYAHGTRVTDDVVRHFCAPRASAQAFRAVEALLGNNRADALTLLAEQLRAGEDAFKLFGLYAYHVRSLVAVADCVARGITSAPAVAAETALKPFVVRTALGAVRTASLPRLLHAHARLTALDADVKRGALTMEDALYDFVARV